MIYWVVYISQPECYNEFLSCLGLYTLRRDSSLHCISSSKHAIQLYKYSSKLIEMNIYSGVSCFFWECIDKTVYEGLRGSAW